MKANRSKPRGAVAFGAKLIRLVFWFPSIYSPTYWLLITAVLWWQRGQSRSATGTLPETRRLLLSVTRSIELLLIKCTLIYGFKVTECAFSSHWQVQAVVWWSSRYKGDTTVSGGKNEKLLCAQKTDVVLDDCRQCQWIFSQILQQRLNLSETSRGMKSFNRVKTPV